MKKLSYWFISILKVASNCSFSFKLTIPSLSLNSPQKSHNHYDQTMDSIAINPPTCLAAQIPK